MSTIPPAPPPPPPPSDPDPRPQKNYINSSHFTPACEWDLDRNQMWEACVKYNICVEQPPYKYKYSDFKSILQVGPTCGIVALSMVVKGEVTPDEILNISKSEGYTCNGEMFSCKNMVRVAETVLDLADMERVSCKLGEGGLFSQETIETLLNGAVLLVPYDADCNHTPCLRQGHTAHWALISGVIIIKDPGESYTADPSNVYVLARHGKSKYLTAWRLDVLEKSNKNLREFSPKKGADGLTYILPEDGIGGSNGLRNQFLIFEGL